MTDCDEQWKLNEKSFLEKGTLHITAQATFVAICRKRFKVGL